MTEMSGLTPRARHTDLVAEPVDDELVVYDRARDRAHRLNRSAALVWRHADGQRTVADLAALLREALDPHADEDLVWVALDRLSAAHLLDPPLARSADEARRSRRAFIRKVGLLGTVALLLPVVTTITAPTPADAQTCNCVSCCNCQSCGSVTCIIDVTCIDTCGEE
jgi:hypothetical protein